MKLSNQPYKGCNDYLPSDMQKLRYIFDIWKKVSEKYNYKEYLTPVLEYAEIYEAKSGEDIRKELYTLEDTGGRRLAMRPEMTPSVTRLVTKIYGAEIKPIRLFSIANFFRGEKPQKGRYREFWQLNIDIFGDESIFADIEILMSAIDMMLAFGAPKGSFIMKLNHRELINFLLSDLLNLTSKEQKTDVVRKLDKYSKLSAEDFALTLHEIGLDDSQVQIVQTWMKSSTQELLQKYPEIVKNSGYQQISEIIDYLSNMGFGEYVKYSTELIRGFDYYDGSIFEVFDLDERFSRSLFGGGRYNGLAELFGNQKIPAVGYAPGSPISFFLDNWNLWPDFDQSKKMCFVPFITENKQITIKSMHIAQEYRSLGFWVETGYFGDIAKALSYANKKGFETVIILGDNEYNRGEYLIKNMKTGDQESKKFK